MSFDLDTTGMMSMASRIFNGIGPIFFVIAGVSIGIGLLLKIVGELRRVF